MMKKVTLILSLTLAILLILFVCLPVKGERILKKIPIDKADKITIYKTIENETDAQNSSISTISDEAVQHFILYFKETVFQNLYDKPFQIQSKVRYEVRLAMNDDTVQVILKFYNDDAVIIDCMYADRPAYHGRYKIKRTALIDYFETVVNENK